jgi:RNA polymerase sigma factor (sigma-70 family)
MNRERDKKLSNKQWELVNNNLNLVENTLNTFKKEYYSANEDLDEYREAGLEGLIHASRKYNSSKNIKFSTYAITAIHRDMLRTHFDRKKRKERFNSREDFQENVEKNTFENTIDKKSVNILNCIISREDINVIRAIIRKSPNKHKEIFRLRFIEEKTLKEIGEHFGVTREMARIYCLNTIKYFSEKMKGL